MQFTDEDSRHQYHGSSSLLQIVCSMFESFAFLHGIDPEFITLNGDTKALIGCPNIRPEQTKDILQKINAQFKRNDKRQTARVSDPDLGVFEILVTGAKDFKNLH